MPEFIIPEFIRTQWKHIIKYAACCGVLIMFLSGTACTAQERRPQERETKEEPTISLYIAESGEEKELKIEEYLQGVVAAEMEPSWPLEALAAQAILARTFTLERIASTGGVPQRGTDASTNVEEFQAYDTARINANVVKAVENTRGEVAKYNGKYIKAWFYADGGGITAASAEEGLAYTKEPSPYVQSVKDPGFAITAAENKAWRAEFPLTAVRESVKKVSGSDPGPVTEVKIAKKGPSGRVMLFKIGSVSVSGPALRIALGSEKMRSTLLTGLSVEGGKLVVTGKGFGHGVGMSQWGAKALAEQGKSPEDIIQYFYRDIKIVKEW